MKRLLIILIVLLGLSESVWAQTDSHILANNTGTAPVRTSRYTRTSDSQQINMQLFQESWLEMDFGSSAAGGGNQIFNEATADATSAAVSVTGANLSNYLAVTCECDDTDVDFRIRPGYRHYNATDKVSAGAVMPFDNSIGTISGFTTLETSFRHNGTVVISTLGAKEILFFLDITAGAAPRVSCWYSRL